MASRITVPGTLSADVAANGTFTVSYPNAIAPEIGITDEGDFYQAIGHSLVIGNNDVYSNVVGFGLTLTTASITVTNKSTTTWPAGTSYNLMLEMQGKDVYTNINATGSDAASQRVVRAGRADTIIIELGSPDALITNGVMAQQNRTNAGALLVNGTLAVSGSVTLDKPRNLIFKSGGADTAVVTATGLDEYGATMSEAATLNGTTAVNGKKAFKKITAISTGAAISNTAFIGTGDVLGLPVYVPSAFHILAQGENGTAATAGTFVAGLKTAGGSTTTTADVRGTMDPNSACDGDISFQLLIALPDISTGLPQA